MAPWCGRAARALRSARHQPSSGAAVGTWAPPVGPSSSLVPTPTPPAWPAAPSPAAAPGSYCSRSRSLHPSPAPSSPACHRRLMVSPTPPPPPRQSSAQPARVRHPEMERLPGDQESQEHTRTVTHRRTRIDYKHRAAWPARSRADAQAPGGNNRQAGQEGRGVGSQVWDLGCRGTFWTQGQGAGDLAGTQRARGGGSRARRRQLPHVGQLGELLRKG